MNIELKNIKISDLIADFSSNNEEGVRGYGGKLDIRPPYQREFIYNKKQQEAVINTVMKGFPLNVMYWASRDDGTFEIIDGQQRTLSICSYATGGFAIEGKYYHNLTVDEKERFHDYELTVYVCSGTDSEKLEWFRTINIAGEELTQQELRNAVYAGPWLMDAKRYFSRTGCAAFNIAEKLMRGTPIRQDYLETVIAWKNNGNIEDYMALHQHDQNANDLWFYFNNVITWVNTLFPNYRKEMKGLPWGQYFNEYSMRPIDPRTAEETIKKLMMDDDVTNKRGIYRYILTDDEKYLNIRAFTANQKREAYERQNGLCPICGNHYEMSEMEADHILPWSMGGRTDSDNCQMLCRKDNREKAGK